MYRLAIVGRPNVGKSALFNRICKKRIAIVDEEEGITRDRLYAEAEGFAFPFVLIDTGGIDSQTEDQFQKEIARQAHIAIQEADAIILVVDSTVGVTHADEQVARILLRLGKPLTLAVNKIDSHAQLDRLHSFYTLGISAMVGVSALHGYQIAELLEMAWRDFTSPALDKLATSGTKVAIIGRTNVGKSTLINTLLTEERCVASPVPGTTRDSVDIGFTFQGRSYTLIDTAGIRRKKAEHTVVEKYAAIRTQKAIARCDIVLLLIDAQEGLTAQEKRIVSQIEAAGKGCVVALNKWDLVTGYRMEHLFKALQMQAPFLTECPCIFISAKTGKNVEKILDHIDMVVTATQSRIPTHQLNKFVARAIQLNHPPMIGGKRLRIYYLTQVDVAPPRFILFVNKPQLLHASYKKYLINSFRKTFPFAGSPLVFHLRGKPERTAPHSKGTQHDLFSFDKDSYDAVEEEDLLSIE